MRSNQPLTTKAPQHHIRSRGACFVFDIINIKTKKALWDIFYSKSVTFPFFSYYKDISEQNQTNSWWIYETDYGKREDMTENSWIEDGPEKSVNLITLEALYVFLQENARHNDSNEPTASGSNPKTISMEEFMQTQKSKYSAINKQPISTFQELPKDGLPS